MHYRKSLRYSILLPVKGRKLAGHFETTAASNTVLVGNTSIEDIGAHGLFLASDTKLWREDVIELAFFLPKSNKPIGLKAKVLWLKEQQGGIGKYGYGMIFVEINEDDRLRIIDLLLQKLSKKDKK